MGALSVQIQPQFGQCGTAPRADLASDYWCPIGTNNPLERMTREIRRYVSEPLQTAVKKASKQIAATKQALQLGGAGVLIGVNNGYSLLTAENFENLLVRRCQNNSTQIDHVVCITVAYHQGPFDAFIFCTTRCRAVRGDTDWVGFDPFLVEFDRAFDRAMGQMMADQMNPELVGSSLAPVKTILFKRDGVVYERQAPPVPSSLG